MKTIKIFSQSTILEQFSYKITSDNFTYKAFTELPSPIKSILKEKRAYLLKISVINENNEIISIFKNYQSPITSNLFEIIANNTTYYLKESNNFRMPDFFINTDFGKVEISGLIAKGEYFININNKKIANINTYKSKEKKEYNLEYDTDYDILKELLISIVLILDNLYHYY
ncbi:hypothetical protein [Peptoniphilus stercorisuis]|uniref:Uncharacterized protein n=1 Tax=Peptoniphilus stercorisuis TaxID=1436965 RepID=A0ABS4KCC0_9FIRM|nr:hypothetical protein [Peptoniphilus stercorisuis]MBP2025434.1 hypothetical protein [Peptoniphilus stercorisuis]